MVHWPIEFAIQNRCALAFASGPALVKQADPWSSKPPDAGDVPPWAMEMIDDAM